MRKFSKLSKNEKKSEEKKIKINNRIPPLICYERMLTEEQLNNPRRQPDFTYQINAA